MIRGEIQAADYRAEVAAAFTDRGGVRCTFSRDGSPASIVAQLHSSGCVTLTYRATPDADPKSIFVSFMDELAITRRFVYTDIEGEMTVE
jgi:hypothetical protein